MGQKIITIPIVILSAIGLLFLARFVAPEDAWICSGGEWIKHGNPNVEKPLEDCPGKINSANIVVGFPESNQIIGRHLVIKGKARVFENQFNWAVKNEISNEVIKSGTAYANAEDMGLYGLYEIGIDLDDATPDKIVVDIFDYSAKDGAVQDLVSIPLVFDKNIRDFYEVYFSNNNLDPNSLCLKVFPIIKPAIIDLPVPGGEDGLRRNIEALLVGPSDADKERGYFTNIPDNVRLNKIEIKDNYVKLDFSKEMENNVAGSCRVTAIRAQIVRTALAFDRNIRSVIISVNGKTEEALQP